MQDKQLIVPLGGDAVAGEINRKLSADMAQEHLLCADLEFEKSERRFVFKQATDRLGTAGHVIGLSVRIGRLKSTPSGVDKLAGFQILL